MAFGQIKYIAAAALGFTVLGALPMTALAQQTRALTPAELRVCPDLDACVDLLLTHQDDEFDYAVLAAEFRRLGPKATAKLLAMSGGKREKAARHAIALLSQPGWQFRPAEQSRIAQLWPSPYIRDHAALMASIPSPMMRDRFIETLDHPDAKIREASRAALTSIMTQQRARKIKPFPLKPQSFAPLAKAAINDPTADIVDLLSQFPITKTRPILKRVLLAEDGGSVLAAYQRLYAENQEAAFKSLLAALQKIETPAQALAISDMLRARNQTRADGFYLKFAADIAGDETFPVLARMAGLDAVLSQTGRETNIVRLADSQVVRDSFAFALAQQSTFPSRYLLRLEDKVATKPLYYVQALWKAAGQTTQDERVTLLGAAAKHANADTIKILREGLADKTDWRVTKTAALALGGRKDVLSKPALLAMSKAHPIVDVRAAALTALRQIDGKPADFKSAMRSLHDPKAFCPVAGHDFKDDAQQLPYFTTGIYVARGQAGEKAAIRPAARLHIASAAPLKDGWLTGYDLGMRGGSLVYFDNKSGEAELLNAENVRAIIPAKKVPLGQYASDFWVLAGLPGQGALYRASQGAQGWSLRLHAHLPSLPRKINVGPDQSVQIGFSNKVEDPMSHPPLRVMPGGAIVPGCAPKRTKAGSAKALPN